MSFPLFERYVKNDWLEELKPEFQRYKIFYEALSEKIERIYADKQKTPVYPENIADIFKAFNLTPLSSVKVVILGQDPYHEPYADGLSFSVKNSVAEKDFPPSLQNIFNELENDDVEFETPSNGSLEKWTEQGVLLLNTILTVGEKAKSHENLGWQVFTDAVIKLLNEQNRKIVFILWGNEAIEKERIINNPIHEILKSYHPIGLGNGKAYDKFSGSKPFSKANGFLKVKINWRL